MPRKKGRRYLIFKRTSDVARIYLTPEGDAENFDTYARDRSKAHPFESPKQYEHLLKLKIGLEVEKVDIDEKPLTLVSW